MPTFTGGNGAFTPSTSQDNWTLDSQTAGVFAKVVAIGWGGREVTSTNYRTRWYRPTTAGSSTFTTLGPAAHQPNYGSPGARIGTFATAPSTTNTDPAGNLWGQDWNGQGGVGMIVMPLANPWWIVNGILTGQIGCRNVTGSANTASVTSYECTWEE